MSKSQDNANRAEFRTTEFGATSGRPTSLAGPTAPVTTVAATRRSASTGTSSSRSLPIRAAPLAASRVGRRVVASYGTATLAPPTFGTVAPSFRMAGTRGSVGTAVGPSVTARTPSRTLVRPAPALAALVGTGRLVPIAIVVVSARSVGPRRATRVATAALVADGGVAAIATTGVASAVALEGTGTAIRPCATVRVRLVGTPLVAGLRSVAATFAASRTSSRGIGRTVGARPTCPPTSGGKVAGAPFGISRNGIK